MSGISSRTDIHRFEWNRQTCRAPKGECRWRGKAGKCEESGGKEGRTDSPKTKIYYGNFIDNCHCKLTSLPLLSLLLSWQLSALRCRGFVVFAGFVYGRISHLKISSNMCERVQYLSITFAAAVAAYGNHMAKCQQKTNTVTDNKKYSAGVYGVDFVKGIRA